MQILVQPDLYIFKLLLCLFRCSPTNKITFSFCTRINLFIFFFANANKKIKPRQKHYVRVNVCWHVVRVSYYSFASRTYKHAITMLEYNSDVISILLFPSGIYTWINLSMQLIEARRTCIPRRYGTALELQDESIMHCIIIIIYSLRSFS